jgi:ATP-dependent DNA helicase RecQ
MPGTLEAYYQEAGRAGRDGLPATAILLHAFPDRFTHEFFINGALPARETVEAVYEACRKVADADGLVSADAAAIAATAKGKVSDREAASALRILARGTALAVADASQSMAQVRLLATTDRLKRELSEAEHGLELALLRSLWRRARGAFHDGIVADLGALPPGLAGIAGASGAAALLDALQARQILVWRRLGEGITLSDASRPIDTWPVDWAGLGRRRSGELKKLEMMQKYAYTDSCRRAFVLRYFGDPAARPRCDNCDRCLGIVHAATAPAATPARKRHRAAGAAAGSVDAPLTRDELDRVDQLRALRSRLARDEEVPAYVIFPDRALREIARARPASLADLARVHGVGPARLDRYGREVLEVLRALSSPPAGTRR